MLASEITWKRFASIHENPTKEFERLCWHLFKHYYVHNESIPHSNPNNPGIEIDPVLARDSKTRISFQSKRKPPIRRDAPIRHSPKSLRHFTMKESKPIYPVFVHYIYPVAHTEKLRHFRRYHHH